MSIRIAYENLLDESLNLTATNVDNDSSVNNLFHPYLEHAMNCDSTNTTVTGRFVEAKTVTCIAVAFHTAEQCTLNLYGLSGNVLLTKAITLEVADAIYYLDSAIEEVYSFSLAFTSGEQIRIGYIYLGRCHEFPSIKREGKYSVGFTGTSEQSKGGQTYGVFGAMLRKASVSIPRMTGTERNNFIAYLSTVQNVKPHMIDLFPDSHEYESSLYCTVNSNLVDFTKRWESGFFYSVPMEWQEAR